MGSHKVMTLDEARALKDSLITEVRRDRAVTERVAARFMAFKYKPKEKKKSKIDRLSKFIRDKTGIGRGTAEDIADAIIRGRDLDRLAVQKNWPVEDGTIEGSKGSVKLDAVKSQL